MYKVLFFFLAAAIIGCAPVDENLEDLNTDSIDFSSIPYEEENGTDNDYDIAETCSSSLDNSEILRRQSCPKKSSDFVNNPREPGPGVTLNPRIFGNFVLQDPPDPECVNFSPRSIFVSCGGPEGQGASDKYYDSFAVLNCIRGMIFFPLDPAP